MNLRRTAYLLTFVLVTTVGCDDEKDTDGPAEVTQQADAGSPDASGPPQIRMAFGIPLPPEGTLQVENEYKVKWLTKLSVAELEEFYNGRLTDYEVIREGTTLRIIGLRSNMASAFATHLGREHMPVEMVFEPASVPLPPGAHTVKLDLDGAEVAQEPTPVPEAHFGGGEKGSPVTARLPNGELIAPGARWGEPYTPPEGSFYRKRKFKPNWGRPFGDWRAF